MKALLIPSAVLISREMRKKFGDIPPALFPLGEKTILEHVCAKYKESVDKIYLVAYKQKHMIVDYIQIKKLPVEIIELDKLRDLGYTIRYGIEAIVSQLGGESLDYLYINFADSLLEDELLAGEKDVVYYAEDYSMEDWTYFEDKDGRIVSILDKAFSDNKDEQEPDLGKVFVGVFGLADPQDFLRAYGNDAEGQESIDSFYAALRGYSEKHRLNIEKTDKWTDVGHSYNYFKAKTKVAAREFNSIEIDEARGILCKRSDNREKLIDEIRWYLRLPSKLQYLLPRIYDYSLDYSMPYVSMEYYGYHTLHESLLYGNLSLLKWQSIFKKILFAIEDMDRFKVTDQREKLLESLRDIYLDKTFKRLGKMRDTQAFQPFFQQSIVINGKQYRSLDEYMGMLPGLVEELVLKQFKGEFNIIHGDLCFANILIEDTYNFIRLIDPRGRFGEYDIYGDPTYELAKLLHTLEGKYDFIIEDMFVLQADGNKLEYHVRQGNCENILNTFLNVFREKIDDLQAIRLIEATLFLSMIPLHGDFPQRQLAMLATGVMLLEDVIGKAGKG